MATQPITSTTVPGWARSTAGRTGATYSKWLAANPQFDPWANLEQYVGAGGSQSPALQQAFGWLNEWARNNGLGDGSRIPLQQRQQMFMAFLERAHQGIVDRGENWEADAAARLPSEGWVYTAGTGGKSVAQGGNIAASGQVEVTSAGVTPGTAGEPTVPYTAGQPTAPNAAAPNAAAPNAAAPGGTTVIPGGGMGPSLIPGVPGGPLPATTGAKNIALQDPKMALDYVMQQMGINTDRPGIFTDQIEQAMGDLLTPYTQLAGIWEPGGSPAAYADNPQYYLGQFAQNMQGGHGYAGLANMANQIGGDPRWNKDIIGSLGAKAAVNAMQNRMFLGNAGTNPLYNQARAARWASAFGDKYHPGAFGRASADQPNLQPADWLAGSPWKDLLNNY